MISAVLEALRAEVIEECLLRVQSEEIMPEDVFEDCDRAHNDALGAAAQSIRALAKE